MTQTDEHALRAELRDAQHTARRYTALILRWLSRNRTDILIAAVLSLIGGVAFFFLALQIPPELIDPELDAWVWFESDLIRVQQTMIDRWADNHRTTVHPLQPLITAPLPHALHAAGLSERLASILFLATVAGLWCGMFFAAFRGLRLRRLDGLVFTAFAASTGSAIFWLPSPEVTSIGSLLLLTVFAFGTIMQRGGLPPLAQSAVSALSLAITTTNWMAGILLTFGVNSYRRTIRITFDSLLIVTLLFAVQKKLFPRSEFFVPQIRHELGYILHELGGTQLNKMTSFFVYSVAVPPVPFLDNPEFPEWMRITIQTVPLSQLQPLAWTGIGLWLFVLLCGLVAAAGDTRNRVVAQSLALFVAFELLLHSFFGDETFLYSLNFLPPMILLASLSTLTRMRPVVLVAISLSTLAIATNNISEYLRVTEDVAVHAAAVVAARQQ